LNKIVIEILIACLRTAVERNALRRGPKKLE
jgi:hypothetical protein